VRARGISSPSPHSFTRLGLEMRARVSMGVRVSYNEHWGEEVRW